MADVAIDKSESGGAKALPRLQAVRRSTLKDQTYLELRRALISGRFEPGQQITVRELADVLGSGVMPVRESVQRLVAEGAMVSLPTGRIHVPKLTRAEFEQIVELRLLLEPLSTAKAAEADGEALSRRLAELQVQMEAAVSKADPEQVLWANFNFHFTIYDHARAPLLYEHIESLWLRIGPMIVHLLRVPGPRHDLLQKGADMHGELCDVLKRNDPRAAKQAMTTIIRTAAGWYRTTFPFADET